MNDDTKEILSIVLLIFLPIILFFISFLLGRYPISPVDVISTILCPVFPQLEVSPTITTIVFEIRLPILGFDQILKSQNILHQNRCPLKA